MTHEVGVHSTIIQSDAADYPFWSERSKGGAPPQGGRRLFPFNHPGAAAATAYAGAPAAHAAGEETLLADAFHRLHSTVARRHCPCAVPAAQVTGDYPVPVALGALRDSTLAAAIRTYRAAINRGHRSPLENHCVSSSTSNEKSTRRRRSTSARPIVDAGVRTPPGESSFSPSSARQSADSPSIRDVPA